jgi:hypothetical protein
MYAGEIIEKVKGLTHDKLTYFVRAGYINPQKIKKGSLFYNEFSEKDFFLVSHAWNYIQTYDMKTRAAFERAQAEFVNPQMSFCLAGERS